MRTWLLTALLVFNVDTFCAASTFALRVITTFGFFSDTEFRDPTESELSGLVDRTTEFYEGVYKRFYKEAFNSIDSTAAPATTNNNARTVRVVFNFTMDISVGPVIQQAQTVGEQSNRHDYVWFWVWDTEDTDLFINVDAGNLERNFNVTALTTDPPTEAPAAEEDDGLLCFSGVSTVQVLGKGRVSMTELQVGDHVLSNKNEYEPIYAFGHYSPQTSAEFLQIHTNTPKIDGAGYDEAPLEVTNAHLVFVDGKKNPVRADSINIGDALQAQGSSRVVTKVSRITRNGVYNPLTPSGTLIVDGVAASSYISFQDDAQEYIKLQGGIPTFFSNHDFVHVALSPFRMLCMNTASSRLCDSYNDQGLPPYVSSGIKLIEWINDQNIVLQGLALATFILVCGTFAFVEQAVGAFGTLAILTALATTLKLATTKTKKTKLA